MSDIVLPVGGLNHDHQPTVVDGGDAGEQINLLVVVIPDGQGVEVPAVLLQDRSQHIFNQFRLLGLHADTLSSW